MTLHIKAQYFKSAVSLKKYKLLHLRQNSGFLTVDMKVTVWKRENVFYSTDGRKSWGKKKPWNLKSRTMNNLIRKWAEDTHKLLRAEDQAARRVLPHRPRGKQTLKWQREMAACHQNRWKETMTTPDAGGETGSICVSTKVSLLGSALGSPTWKSARIQAVCVIAFLSPTSPEASESATVVSSLSAKKWDPKLQSSSVVVGWAPSSGRTGVGGWQKHRGPLQKWRASRLAHSSLICLLSELLFMQLVPRVSTPIHCDRHRQAGRVQAPRQHAGQEVRQISSDKRTSENKNHKC